MPGLSPHSCRGAAPLAAGILALLPASGALAAPPTADDFQVYYYLTDADGNRDRRMNLQDMQQYFNRARCECGQEIQVEVTLQATGAQMIDQVQLQTFFGPSCDKGQTGNTSQFFPCLLLDTTFPNAFQGRKTFQVHPVWLAAGINGSVQTEPGAEPRGTCDMGQGAGGLWMCAENGMMANCQSDEFFLTDTNNDNVPMDMTAQAVAYDFIPPVATVSNPQIEPGDGAVEVSWTLDAFGDIAGFRVLCANQDGTPVAGKGMDPPSLTAQNNGNTYYQASSLCPDGPFSPFPGEDSGTGGSGGTGGSTGGTGGTGGTAGTGGSGTGTAGGTGSTDTGTAGATGATDTGTAGGTGTAGTTGGGGGSPLLGLGYEYVCTGHLGSTTSKTRVEGLKNGVTYDFLLIAYDQFGNAAAVSSVLTATPQATNDLWDECQDPMFKGVCGERGFCSCRTGDDAPAAPLELSALALLLTLGRRRRRRRTRR